MKKILKAFICTLSLIPMMGFGQIVKTVEASGMGSSEKSAMLDASRNAVSQVVTTLVESQTTTLDEKIVEDKIIAVSGGFIDNLKVIEPAVKNASGAYTIKIQADVKYDQLSTEIAKYSSSSKKINMGAIMDEQAQKQKEEELAALVLGEKQSEMGDFLIKLIDDYVCAWKFDVIECLPGADEHEVILNIQGSLSNDDYVSKFVLPTQKKFKALGITSGKSKSSHYFVMNTEISHNTVIYPLAVFDESVDGKKPTGFKDFYLAKVQDKKYIVRIEIKDSKNEVLSTTENFFWINYDPYRINFLAIHNNANGNTCSIIPKSGYGQKNDVIKREKTIKMKVYAPNKITDIDSVDIKLIEVDRKTPCKDEWKS